MSAPIQNNPPAQKRSRIVIDLEGARKGPQQQQQPGPGGAPPAGTAYAAAAPRGRRKRWPLVLGIVGSVLLIATTGGYFYWRHLKTKPAYSIALAVDAAQRDDAAAFDQVFDTDKVVASFTPQVIDEATARLGTAVTPSMRKRIEAVVPLLIPKVRDSVRGEVMKHVRKAALRAEGKPFFMIALTISYLVDIKQEGDTATALAKTGERNIDLAMQRDKDGRWKIVGVKDPVLAKRLVDDLAKDLPAIGPAVLDEARRKILGQLRNAITAPGR